MKSNLLQYYLNWNVKCYVLIILGISCLIVYVVPCKFTHLIFM